jgi:hypothetical protein
MAKRHDPRRQAAFLNRRRGELRRLFQHRGMSRWQADSEIAGFGDLTAWSADALGNRLGLTFADKIDLDIQTIRCIDKTPAEVSEFYEHRQRERRRERQAEYARERRARIAFAANLDVRREALLEAIPIKPISVPQLIRNTGMWPCWTMPNGKRLTGTSLAAVIRRELDHLEDAGFIMSELRTGKRGAKVRWVRRLIQQKGMKT